LCRIAQENGDTGTAVNDKASMPSDQDRKTLKRLQAGAAENTTAKLVDNLPPVPADVKKRFPSMQKWEESQKDWVAKLIIALRGGQGV